LLLGGSWCYSLYTGRERRAWPYGVCLVLAFVKSFHFTKLIEEIAEMHFYISLLIFLQLLEFNPIINEQINYDLSQC